MNRIYMCIDLKSFYASVECRDRNLDPLNTNLVVADKNRTDKTICLAVSPSLKQYGIPGRARLYEVIQKVREINLNRKRENNNREFIRESYIDSELKQNKNLKLSYIVAQPRMSNYIKYSTKIYGIYLKYLSSEDIFVYSIDEVFCDITNYLKLYKKTPRELVTMIIHDVYNQTGITATAGIGTNLYLAKIAMDIDAKKSEPDIYGVRISELDEMSYRTRLWDYKPITKFWRVGKGIAKTLEDNYMYTMGDIARCSIENEDLLYKLFGVNAELLIDHSWGYEPCTMESIKAYKPSSQSISSGQVLHEPYEYKKAKVIVKEMSDAIGLSLVEKGLCTNQIVLNIGYDIESLKYYDGEIKKDMYGRSVPKPSHGSINLKYMTSSSKIICNKTMELFESIIDKKLLVRRINITVNNLKNESDCKNEVIHEQLDLFSNNNEVVENINKELESNKEENKIQHVMINIKNKYGKNAILKGMNYEPYSTSRERNKQIGGHSE